MYALNACASKRATARGKAICPPITPAEGGLDRFIKFDKPQDFPGKAALLAEKQQGVNKRFVTLTLDDGLPRRALYVDDLHDGEVVGETTSGAWGYRVGKSIALGMLRPDLAVPAPRLTINIFGNDCQGDGARGSAALGS